MWQKRAFNIVKLCDIFGVPIKFTLNKQYLQKSLFGAFLSISLIMVFIVIGIQCSFDLINHTDFFIYSQEMYYKSAPLIDFSSYPLEFALSFGDSRLNNGGYFKIDITQSYTVQNNSNSKRKKIPIITEKCTRDSFRKDLQSSFLSLENNKSNLNSYLCPQKGQIYSLEGTYQSSDFSFITIKISACQNTSSITCVSQTDMDKVFTDNDNKIFFNVFLSNYITNLQDFDKPIYSYLDDKVYVLLDREYYKEKNFYLTQQKVSPTLIFYRQISRRK